MRVSQKIGLALLVMACVPLSVAGWQAIRMSRAALDRRTGELHKATAELLADKVEATLSGRERSLRQSAGMLLFGTMSAAETLGALRWTFKQLEDATVVVLLTGDGQQVVDPVHLTAASADPALAGRPPASNEDVSRFGEHIPFAAARNEGAAMGPPYLSTSGAPRVSFAAQAHGDSVLAVEVALDRLAADMLARHLGPRGRTVVVDADGRVVVSDDVEAVAQRQDLSDWPPVAALLANAEVPRRFTQPALGDVFGAGARVPDADWSVVVLEPVEDALAASYSLMVRTLIWLAGVLLAGVFVSLWLGRAISRPIRALHSSATAISEGNLSARVANDSQDELGELARAFNRMAEDVERWSQELESRVADKTKQLEEMQEVLMRAQKLAAVGQLGAGVAHEINNPLTGILGLTQLLLAKEQDDKKKKKLTVIESEAHRIMAIVENLHRLAEGSEGFTTSSHDIHTIINNSLSMVRTQLAGQNIELTVEPGDDVPPVACDAQRLCEVFLELATNAMRAMPDGGKLDIATRSKDGKLVVVSFSDTGEGVPTDIQDRIFEPFFTTKKDWHSKGMGLSMVNQIIEKHQGTIVVDSEVGRGSTFKITLLAHQKRSLL